MPEVSVPLNFNKFLRSPGSSRTPPPATLLIERSGKNKTSVQRKWRIFTRKGEKPTTWAETSLTVGTIVDRFYFRHEQRRSFRPKGVPRLIAVGGQTEINHLRHEPLRPLRTTLRHWPPL